jgi:hypothetical protein
MSKDDQYAQSVAQIAGVFSAVIAELADAHAKGYNPPIFGFIPPKPIPPPPPGEVLDALEDITNSLRDWRQ